jgi:hypothetical protein
MLLLALLLPALLVILARQFVAVQQGGGDLVVPLLLRTVLPAPAAAAFPAVKPLVEELLMLQMLQKPWGLLPLCFLGQLG